jgi:hypothetical protein
MNAWRATAASRLSKNVSMALWRRHVVAGQYVGRRRRCPCPQDGGRCRPGHRGSVQGSLPMELEGGRVHSRKVGDDHCQGRCTRVWRRRPDQRGSLEGSPRRGARGRRLGATPSSQWRGRRNFGIGVILESKRWFVSCGWTKKPRKARRKKPVGEVDENKPTECFAGGIRNALVLLK